MPLLALPSEIVKEIIRLAIQPLSPSADSCSGPGCPGEEDSGRSPCTPPAATALAHTCQILRSHTLPHMYASVTVNLAHARTLHTQLTASSDIASCVRTLTLFITDAGSSQLLYGLIRRCGNLEDLRLDGSQATGHSFATPLIHASQRPLQALTLRTFEWLEIWTYLCSPPRSLHTLRFEDPVRPFQIIATSGAPVAVPTLPHVHTFVCHMALFDQRTAQHAGGWLACAVPSATVLDIHLCDTSVQVLHAYAALGTRLAELTVHFLSAQPAFCRTLAMLAPSLRRLVVHGGCVCEIGLAARWRCVEVFEVACRGGCKDVRILIVREALVRLVAARPRAVVRVVVDGGHELVGSGAEGANVAGLEAFAVLEEMWEDY